MAANLTKKNKFTCVNSNFAATGKTEHAASGKREEIDRLIITSIHKFYRYFCSSNIQQYCQYEWVNFSL